MLLASRGPAKIKSLFSVSGGFDQKKGGALAESGLELKDNQGAM